jgi:DNA-binding response OmpR family regulator
MEAARDIEVLVVGQLEVRPGESMALAAGRPLTLSVREFALLVELARRKDRIVAREQLFERVWGTRLRAGDRSVDVYVHKLRVKLEDALPGWRFIHTHVGFGYRLSAEPLPAHSHPFHKDATTR